MEEQGRPFGGISGSTLKLIAIITMFIDHTGATAIYAVTRLPAVAADPGLRSRWLTVYSISRDIGRLAFPIFCFLLVEGFIHTRSVKRYAGRLFLFALISEIPFDIALKGSWYYPQKQNVYFTLLIGLLVLTAISYCERIPTPGRQNKTAVRSDSLCLSPNCEGPSGLLYLLPSALAVAAGMYLASFIDTDYNCKGVFLIAALYLVRHSRLFQCAAGAAATAWELPAPLGFIPVYLYNGKRGLRMKYFFYWFYPAHLMLLYVVTNHVIPAILL